MNTEVLLEPFLFCIVLVQTKKNPEYEFQATVYFPPEWTEEGITEQTES